ncbi:TetR family transcriptional regulator, partial [Stenotrophomonas sp. HMWF022]
MAAATVLSPPEDANSPARRTVSREDLLAAALKLIGPHRSLSTLS